MDTNDDTLFENSIIKNLYPWYYIAVTSEAEQRLFFCGSIIIIKTKIIKNIIIKDLYHVNIYYDTFTLICYCFRLMIKNKQNLSPAMKKNTTALNKSCVPGEVSSTFKKNQTNAYTNMQFINIFI